MTDRFYYFSFVFFRFLVRNLPRQIVNAGLEMLASFIRFFDKKHRRIVQTNLNFALGDSLVKEEKKKIEKNCYVNMLFNLADFVRNQGITKEELARKIRFKNSRILKKAIQNGQKIILITAHYGNWELIPLALAAFFKPLTIVGRPLDSKVMNEILQKNREQYNIEMLNKKGAMKGLIKALSQDRMVGLLVDQNTKPEEGILVDFFGKKARHTPTAALLARRFDAAIIPVFITSTDHKTFTLTFYDKIITPKTENADEDIHESVQAQADITEKVIRQKPDEWFWFHKRWKNQYPQIY